MSTKYEEKRAALESEHARKTADLELERSIWEHLPEALAQYDPFVHVHKLYGHVARVHFRFCEYETLRKGPDPTLQTVLDLAVAFPVHVPLSLYRSGTVGVREDSSIAPEEYDKDHVTILPLAPYLLRLNRLSDRLEIEWTAIVGEQPIRIYVAFRPYGEVGKLFGRSIVEYEYVGSGEYRRVVGVRSNRFELAQVLHVINDAKAEQIRYSSGDYKRPGDILCYWDSCNGEHAQSTVIDLVKAVQS
jgi:hypothetical protein